MSQRHGEFRCENLRKSFDGVQALQYLDVTLPRTGIVALIGPNGAGKTTLFDVLTGFAKPEGGKVYFGNVEITGRRPASIAKLGIARTFQDVRVISRVSVLENVLLAKPRQRGEKLFYAFSRWGVDIEEKANIAASMELLRFVGLDTFSQKLAGELSYGQQKLLSLASCLSTGAVTMLLDEPVAGVDPKTTARVLDLMRNLRETGKNIIFIEHDISTVREIPDEIVVMDEGRVIAQGSPEEVLERREIMEAYLA